MVSRPLTTGEVQLAKSVFGDSIDYAAVTINDGKFAGFHPEGTAMAPNGNLFMYGCYAEDYSKLETYGQSLFIHEMTHVWQYQNKILAPIAEAVKLNLKHKFNYRAAYDYELEAGKDLTDYNMEQQASIVQDHFALKREAGSEYWSNCQNAEYGAARMALYEQVLDKFLKDPSYARQAQFPTAASKKAPKPPV
ncbi:MAG TPA: type IV secretion protein Rhs [Patescibacteria group bacterium]|nr:type IV secretion protein Rhs [Patescibacteria group bacterium]